MSGSGWLESERGSGELSLGEWRDECGEWEMSRGWRDEWGSGEMSVGRM